MNANNSSQINNQYPFQNFTYNPRIFFPMNNVFLNPFMNMYMNNNIQINNEQNNTPFINNGKPFIIYEAENEIYIENIYAFDVLKILRANPNVIERINNKNSIPKEYNRKTEAFTIIGIVDLYNAKYLGYVSSSEEVAKIFVSTVHVINSIELIKINNIEEPPIYNNLKENIKQYFSTKNLYYSNDYQIALPLSHFNQNIILANKYLINYSFLKPFFDNNIPPYFFCQIIFGFVSYKRDVYIGNNETNRLLDMIIIERYMNGNINPNNDILVYIKQIEFITVFKNKDNSKDNKFFSHVFYESNESINNINSFSPFKMTLVEELNKFKKIFCIVNNLNKNIQIKSLKDLTSQYNKNFLNNKIKLLNFSSDWKKKYFEGIDVEKCLDFYSDNIFQSMTFWFIDINNNNFTNNILVESLKELYWRDIKKQISNQILNIDIGKLNSNNENMIYNEFKKLTDNYENNFDVKKLLLNEHKKIFQVVSDKFLSIDNIRTKINQNIANIETEPENLNKIKILCVTWNVGGSTLPQDYDLLELFTKNHFYYNGQTPDIVVVSIQEIVSLNAINILKSKGDKNVIKNWTKSLKNSLNTIFPDQCYIDPFNLDLVGIYIVLFIKKDIISEILFNDISEDKKGKFNLGNKGFFTFSFQYKDKIFSIASGHLDSGNKKNEKRIKTLGEILNKDIKVESKTIHKFKDADFWVILGDLNFRLELSYYDAICLIQDKNYDALYCMDQFHLAYEDENNSFLKNNLSEGKINFAPTYKFEKNSDNYAFEDGKIRVPSYCDRIFYCKKNGIRILSYERISTLKISDHRPVTAAFEVFWDKNKKENNNNEEKNA